jgi:hypothetical protein
MKKLIFIALLSIVFVSCNSGVSCDSSKVKETALRLFETEIRVQLAWGVYYEEVISPIENTYGGALLQFYAYAAGDASFDIEKAKEKAILSFRKLAKGQTVEDAEKYHPYIRYADSIMDLGKTSLEIIMTTANDHELKKCECEATMVFDPEINIENMDVSYDVQKASDGEVYVTIYMR